MEVQVLSRAPLVNYNFRLVIPLYILFEELKIMSLPLTPYKGARDFYPEDKLRQNYLFSVLRKTVKLYGYEEYDAPILEPI